MAEVCTSILQALITSSDTENLNSVTSSQSHQGITKQTEMWKLLHKKSLAVRDLPFCLPLLFEGEPWPKCACSVAK